MPKLSLENIENDIRERISAYLPGPVFPTDDEITIAWLVSEISRLKEIIINIGG